MTMLRLSPPRTLPQARPWVAAQVSEPLPPAIVTPNGYTLEEQVFYKTDLNDSTQLETLTLNFTVLAQEGSTAIQDLLNSPVAQATLNLLGDALVYMARFEQGPLSNFTVPDSIDVFGVTTITPPFAGQTISGVYNEQVVLVTYKPSAAAYAVPLGARPQVARPLVRGQFALLVGIGVLLLLGVGAVIAIGDYLKGTLDFGKFYHGVTEPINVGSQLSPVVLILALGGILGGAAALLGVFKGQPYTPPPASLPPSIAVSTPGFGIGVGQPATPGFFPGQPVVIKAPPPSSSRGRGGKAA